MTARFQFDDGQPQTPEWLDLAASPPLRFDRPPEASPMRRPELGESLEPVPADLIAIPDGYEDAYAYPLIVWVTPPDASRLELHRVMAQVSSRNYIGLAFRVTEDELRTFDGGSGILSDSCAQRLFQTVRRLRRNWHVHTERVHLAGFGAAGSLALMLALQRPEWFAGVAAFGARLPATSQLLSRYADLRGLRAFLVAGHQDRTVSSADISRAARLLQSAGLKVATRLYEHAGHELTRAMLTELDRWVMQEILEPSATA